MYQIDKSFKKAQCFLKYLLFDSCFQARSVFDRDIREGGYYIYRGHANKEWCLLPSAHRKRDVFKDFIEHHLWEYQIDDELGVEDYLEMWNRQEIDAVQNFLKAADHVGIPTPLDYTLFQEYYESEDSYFSSELLPSIALAQHHGVPTRLLDWTKSPLVAAFFAAKGALSEKTKPKYFSLICVHTETLRLYKRVKVVLAPKAWNGHLRAQNGLFTIDTSANKDFIDNSGEWSSLEKIVEETPVSANSGSLRYPSFIRLSLPNSEAIPLLKLLKHLDVSELTLMPTLQNARKYMKYEKDLWKQGDSEGEALEDTL